ncbi:MAG: hypothetical protein EHM67_06750, partial [Hyphomicrobiaceae bacterium]
MNFDVWVVPLAFLFVAALGGICYWRRQTPEDRARHTVIGHPHDESIPLSLINLPQGSRRGLHNGRVAAILTDGTVMAESAGGTKQFPNLAA